MPFFYYRTNSSLKSDHFAKLNSNIGCLSSFELAKVKVQTTIWSVRLKIETFQTKKNNETRDFLCAWINWFTLANYFQTIKCRKNNKKQLFLNLLYRWRHGRLSESRCHPGLRRVASSSSEILGGSSFFGRNRRRQQPHELARQTEVGLGVFRRDHHRQRIRYVATSADQRIEPNASD